jgi:hypothetical protein
LQVFDAGTRKWSAARMKTVALELRPGEGKLVRVRP